MGTLHCQFVIMKCDPSHMAMQVDTCLETYDSDQDAVLGSAAAGPSSVRLSQTLLQQGVTASGRRSHLSNPSMRPKSSSSPVDDCRHSPDSSATLSGSGPCSDASDLTSSHPSQLPKHHHKRIKLGSAQPSRPDSGSHAAAQCAPDPNFGHLGSVDQAPAQLQAQNGLQLPAMNPFGLTQAEADSQLHDCHVLFQPTLSPPPQLGHRLQGDPGKCLEPLITSQPPAYVSCLVHGLTPAQQLIKEREEQQLAQALQRQQNVYTAGYEMDEFGAVRLPGGQYKRMVSMKVVFAQRWQREAAKAAAPANAGHLSMKQLLLDDAVQLEVQHAPGVAPLDCTPLPGAAQMQVQPGQPVHHAKLPIRLSNLKNAMRKAELSGPELSSSTSSGNHGSSAADERHIAWQVGQLNNTPLLNNAWVEYYVDRFNTEFDNSYWSMLEHLSTSAQ